MAAENINSCALKGDGTLWVWGAVRPGLLDGVSKDRHVPGQLGAATNWVAASMGFYHNILLKADGTLWASGYNGYDQLGIGSAATQEIPVKIGTATNWRAIATGFYHTIALKQDGTLWAWGGNSDGQLGDGTKINRNIPVQIAKGFKETNSPHVKQTKFLPAVYHLLRRD